MKNQDLTQYLFYDRHEELATAKGRIVAVRDPEQGAMDYRLLKNRLRSMYVKFSTSDRFDLRTASKEPKVGEYLVYGSWFLGMFQRISNARIKEINRDFHLPSESE